MQEQKNERGYPVCTRIMKEKADTAVSAQK